MAASLLTLGVLLGGCQAAWAQQITPAFTSPYGRKPAPAAQPAPAPALPPLRSDSAVMEFKKEAQPAEAPLTFTKEAQPVEAPLTFTKEAQPVEAPLTFTKEASPAPAAAPAPVETITFTKEISPPPAVVVQPPVPTPTPAPVFVAKPLPVAPPAAAPVVVAPAVPAPLPQAPLPAPVVTRPAAWSPASPYAVKNAASAPAPLPPVAAKPLPVPAAAPLAPSPIKLTAMQAPKPPDGKAANDESQEYFVQLEPPGPQRLFRLESEQSLHERMRQEALQRPSPDRIEFPSYKLLSDTPFVARDWPLQTETAEACYVCYGRLFFEELNAERYGWDLGVIAPVVSALHFYKDLALLPYHIGTQPFCCFDCSAGYCLPGDPVPYLCYPPKLSLPGTAAEAATVLALMAIFP